MIFAMPMVFGSSEHVQIARSLSFLDCFILIFIIFLLGIYVGIVNHK